MGILPEQPSKDTGPPPLVVYWRDVIRASRLGRFVGRHKNASAAVAALYAVSKVWKWLVFDFIRWGTHPGATFHWAVHHALPAAVLSAAVFALAFGASRFGLGWLTPDEHESPPRERPPDRRTSTYVPGRG